MTCSHDFYHCLNVRRFSSSTRYGGHGLFYSYFASMLATFASGIVGVAWSLKVPTLESLWTQRQRALEASTCWLLVNLMPTQTASRMCGAGRGGALARGFLYAGEGLNKFTSLTRGVLMPEPKGALERLLLVASSGAASTWSRAVTDRCVVNKPWLVDAVSATATELLRNLALAAAVLVAHGESFAVVVDHFRCDEDSFYGFTSRRRAGGWMVQMCVAPEWRVEDVARQGVLLLVFVYLAELYLGKSANPAVFKPKPKTKAKAKAKTKTKVKAVWNQAVGAGANKTSGAPVKTKKE